MDTYQQVLHARQVAASCKHDLVGTVNWLHATAELSHPSNIATLDFELGKMVNASYRTLNSVHNVVDELLHFPIDDAMLNQYVSGSELLQQQGELLMQIISQMQIPPYLGALNDTITALTNFQIPNAARRTANAAHEESFTNYLGLVKNNIQIKNGRVWTPTG